MDKRKKAQGASKGRKDAQPRDALSSKSPQTSPISSTRKLSLITFVVVVLGFATYFILRDRTPPQELSSPSETSQESSEGQLQAFANTANLDTSTTRQMVELTDARLDPSRDGWETEVVAELAKSQMLKIASRTDHALADSERGDEIAESIRFSALRPTDLTDQGSKLLGTDRVTILRSLSEKAPPLDLQGREKFSAALGDLTTPFHDARDENSRDRHVHFKVIRVALEGDTASTVAYYEAEGPSSEGTVQQRATWHCTWRRFSNKSLSLTSLRVTDYEEAVSKGPWLVDSTNAVLAENSSYNQQLRYGLNHWLARLERIRGMHVFTRNGLSLGDVNGDGLEDVYVCQPGGLPNRLYVQQPDGTAIDRSRESGTDWLDQTSSALFLDLDNDGDQDLVAATVAGLLVMENEGTGKFQLRKTLATNDTDTQSFSAADYDNDGDLDLYVCLEFARQFTLQYQSDETFVYHDANDGAANVLFRNEIKAGEWRFTDVTEQVGLDEDNRRHSLACAWEDFDNDGDQDLYVANDYGKNCLYLNTEGVRNRVRNIALEAEGFYQLCVQPWSAMGDMSHSAQRVDAVERFDLDLYAACGAEFFDPASSLDLSSALVPFVHEWSSPLRTRVDSLQEARDVLLARFSALSLPERFQRNERSLAELIRLRDSSLPVTRLHGGRFTLSGLSRLSPLRFRETGPGWPEPQMEVVRSLQGQLAERGVDLIVVPFPSREHVHAPFLISEPPEDGCVAVLREELLRELAMEGVEAIDLLPDFIEAKRGGGLLFHDARDCHAARDGLDLAARAIADRLRRYELPRSIDSIYTRAVSYKLRPENTDMPDKQYPAVQVVGNKGEVVPHEDLSSPIALVGDSFCYFPSHLGPKGTDLASQVAKYTGIVPRRVAIGAGGPRILQHIAERGPEFLDGVRVCVFVCFTDFWYGQAEKGSRRWCPAKLPL